MKTAPVAVAAILFLNTLAPAWQYVISTFAGGGPPPTPAPATSMGIDPQGLAADASGNLVRVPQLPVSHQEATRFRQSEFEALDSPVGRQRGSEC
jgi:hypothetical protein